MAFAQPLGRVSIKEQKKLTKDVKKQLSNLLIRKKQLKKSGQFTPERIIYFKEQEAEIKRALR